MNLVITNVYHLLPANQEKTQTQTSRTEYPTSTSPAPDSVYDTCDRDHELLFQASVDGSAAIRAGNKRVYGNNKSRHSCDAMQVHFCEEAVAIVIVPLFGNHCNTNSV